MRPPVRRSSIQTVFFWKWRATRSSPAQAIQVERRIGADRTVSVLERIVAESGRSPELLRMDNGPEPTANALRDWSRFGGSGTQLHRARLTLAEPVPKILRLTRQRRGAGSRNPRLAARGEDRDRRFEKHLQPTTPRSRTRASTGKHQPPTPPTGRPTDNQTLIASGPTDGVTSHSRQHPLATTPLHRPALLRQSSRRRERVRPGRGAPLCPRLRSWAVQTARRLVHTPGGGPYFWSPASTGPSKTTSASLTGSPRRTSPSATLLRHWHLSRRDAVPDRLQPPLPAVLWDSLHGRAAAVAS